MTRTQSNRIPVGVLGLALIFAGCASAPSDSPSSGSDSGSGQAAKSGGLLGGLLAKTKPVALPEGTVINIVLDQAVASDQNKSGDAFEGTVAEAVVVEGKTVIPKGARVSGTVVEAKESGRLKGVALLRLALNEVEVDGKDYEVQTSAVSFRGQSHTKRNVTMIGGGAGAGAAIGAIAGGGKGAAIGAAAGAGAGTAGAAATGKKDVRLEAETPLTFKLTQPVTIQVRE